jgi:NADPH:quinone reductase-like Zn-dependent oxidoreductase
MATTTRELHSQTTTTMKALIQDRYGSPDVLELREVAKPAPNANEALVKVLAVSVNPADWHCLRGKPVFARATLGLLRPKNTILGGDIAGQVEAVGDSVGRFRPGDEIYANLNNHGFGGFAEYASVPGDVLALKPANLSFEEAAAVPMAGVTALQGLRHHGEIEMGQKVLVNGASGGVGHFAVQIAKSYGAEVTGVTSARNIDLVRSLGADHIIDYTSEDFTRTGQGWDRILDTIGNRSASDLRRALAPGGQCAVIGFTTMGKLLDVRLRGGRRISVVTAHATARDLELLGELIEAGKLRPVIDRYYPFIELPAAIRYLEEGRARGKIAITV